MMMDYVLVSNVMVAYITYILWYRWNFKNQYSRWHSFTYEEKDGALGILCSLI